MKGLASTSPSFATVEISARSARKHYGTASEKVFLEGTHDRNLRYVILPNISLDPDSSSGLKRE